MRCAFPLTIVPLHPHALEWITLSDKDSRQGRRESSWVNTFFDFISIITNCTYSTTACSYAFTFFQSSVMCNFFQYILPFAVLNEVVQGCVDLCLIL